MNTGIKNFLTILFLMIAISLPNKSFAKEIKFIQISDSHFSTASSEYSQQEVENSDSNFAKAIADINTISGIDFVVFTGDNIDTANEKDLKAFLKIANRLKVPYYVVIGNHEVFKSQHFGKKEYMKTVSKYSKNCREKSPNYVFTKKGTVFIVLDGAKETVPGPAGYFKKATLKWFDKQLKKYKNRDVIVFQHFPVVEPYYNRTHTTYNIKDYESILNKHTNVIGIFSGHYHANGEKMVNGVYHVSTPALVVPPHDYKIVEIEFSGKEKPQIYTQLRHAE